MLLREINNQLSKLYTLIKYKHFVIKINKI